MALPLSGLASSARAGAAKTPESRQDTSNAKCGAFFIPEPFLFVIDVFGLSAKILAGFRPAVNSALTIRRLN
jgi:hypothetical protein